MDYQNFEVIPDRWSQLILGEHVFWWRRGLRAISLARAAFIKGNRKVKTMRGTGHAVEWQCYRRVRGIGTNVPTTKCEQLALQCGLVHQHRDESSYAWEGLAQRSPGNSRRLKANRYRERGSMFTEALVAYASPGDFFLSPNTLLAGGARFFQPDPIGRSICPIRISARTSLGQIAVISMHPCARANRANVCK
ncbi:uncharacterized protein LOC143212000 isoform X1 [Lasioglossum baleicum]|uniref:uncharacterized protein LOC143212000 isoform X1 n=1 Tax=Lasioglossum baleicum TaxID=434251 RepID=UPI003FCE3686